MKHNIHPVIPEPVNGQRLCPYGRIPFGWRRIAHNGCVLLAIYNALLLTGYEPDLMEIRSHLHRFWKPRFFGVRNREIARCLKKLGIPFRTVTSRKETGSALEPGAAAIVMSWNRSLPFCWFTMGEEPLSVARFPDLFGGGHGVAACVTEQGVWRVFNRYSNRGIVYEYPNFEAFCPFEALFMKAFIIERKA